MGGDASGASYSRKSHYLPGQAPSSLSPGPVSCRGPGPPRSSVDSPSGWREPGPWVVQPCELRVSRCSLLPSALKSSPLQLPPKSPTPPSPQSPPVQEATPPRLPPVSLSLQDTRSDVSLGSSHSFQKILPYKLQDPPEMQTQDPWVRPGCGVDQTTRPGSPCP